MKLARLTIISASAIAAVIAGVLAMRLAERGPVQKIEIESSPKIKLVNILVSDDNLPVGSTLNSSVLKWVAFPEENVFDGFIDDVHRPKAIEELDGTILRIPLLKGDPVRTEKIVDSSHGNISSLLPRGKRAFATDISVSTASGGMIIPGDRVDVMMTRSVGEGKTFAETILSNIRVLAIDQSLEGEENNKKSLIGATATLELTPGQAKVLLIAQQVASRLTLVLRSVADAKEADSGDSWSLLGDQSESENQTIQIIKASSYDRGELSR
ncbi:Flp pilus assembly protein CpaB [Candidatus Liberibacter sp.]|uniref:Flp pilus assembly protein CpaB n=1 Tax=Candidatus Liberibacter sp. TaxID=34022 RepID=UPI0015F45EBA|nr:Flp pilus assembly protein CpaB [Candidatus Liberibacter sp.]MBA5723931.1 Flp pilus assembly protein CpaB [Candidatus Liberibacter sp.]